jgi:HlyD family secretion protein
MTQQKTGSLVAGGVLLVVAVGIGVATVAKSGGEKGEAVRVATVDKRTITQKVLAQGKVRARTQVEVASEIGGRVSVVNVKVGDVVKVGDPLFALDDEQLKNAVEQLRVALAGAEAMQKRADLGLAEAERGVARDKGLKDKGVIADEQVKLGESRLELARADVDSAKAGIDRTRLDLQRARDALRRARVTAPTAGTVVAVGVEVGQVVSAVQGLSMGDATSSFLGGSSGGPSAPVVIADLSELIVKLDVDELDVGQVKAGQTASVKAQGIKDETFAGVVERVGLMGRDQAGAVLFVVEVGIHDDKASQLKPGMSAQADIEVQKLDGTLAVPVAAVLEGDGKDKPDRVFVYDGDDAGGRVTETKVKLGPSEGDAIAVSDGLQEGQKIVEGPFRALKALSDGERVTIDKKAAADDKSGKKTGDKKSDNGGKS